MADTKTCAYEGCNEPVNSPHDDKYCIFHAHKEKKGITVEEFNGLIREKIEEIFEHNEQVKGEEDKEEFNFKGFIFPGYIYFTHDGSRTGNPLSFNHKANYIKVCFSEMVSFSRSQFLGRTDFDDARFPKYVYFNEALFSKVVRFDRSCFSGYTSFSNTQFLENAYFIDAKFLGDAVFEEAQFSELAEFNRARFTKEAYLSNAIFSNKVHFINVQFTGNAYFIKTRFAEMAVFDKTIFKGMTVLHNLTIEKSAYFLNIVLGQKARFSFSSPIFNSKKEQNICINFIIVQFNPFAVYFENIKRGKGGENGCLIFRYSQLKDVYFTDNDMSLFSFYKSSFDQARFFSSEWGYKNDRILFIPYKRFNVIPEERFIEEKIKNKEDEERIKSLSTNYIIEDLNTYEDVASLYRQMKTALDNTKDYQQASWFYFNEFEMKRKAMEEEIESKGSKLKQIFRKAFSKYFLYFSYKVFAGYGEKPMWSALWMFCAWIFFAGLHLVNGFRAPDGKIINLSFQAGALKSTIYALSMSISRIIPVNYFPGKESGFAPYGLFGIVFSLANTFTLLIFLAFILIGLKRHFRRF